MRRVVGSSLYCTYPCLVDLESIILDVCGVELLRTGDHRVKVQVGQPFLGMTHFLLVHLHPVFVQHIVEANRMRLDTH